MLMTLIWATLNVCLLSVNKFRKTFYNNIFLTGYWVVRLLKNVTPFTKLNFKNYATFG
ncbi:hypothetical protein HNP72_002946 [Sphingobacterium soli]|nr:hypothetical protein [Sphingobacterium soli]